MKRLLETGVGIRIQQTLRNLERQRLPLAAKERDAHEVQQQVLTNPATRETYVHSLRSKVSTIIPDTFIPDESLLKKHEITPDMFFLPIRRQYRAFSSDHNIAHQAIVMVGSLMGIQYIKSQNPETHIDEEAVLTAAALHDTQRLSDGFESVVGLQWHGRIGKWRTEKLMDQMHISRNDQTTVNHVKQMVRYHDVDKKEKEKNYTTELGIMVASDRAALGRLFASKRPLIRASAGYLAADRMRQFKNGGIAGNPQLFADFTEILSALDIMVKDKVAHGDKAQQFQYVIDAAKELGIVKSGSQDGKVAA